MSVKIVNPEPTPIDHPAYVVVKESGDCEYEPLLENLSCHDGPSSANVQEIRTNLLKGDAWEQMVVFLVEEETETPLAVATVCLDGDPRLAEGRLHPFLRQFGSEPYINLVARDDRYPNRVLIDSQTRLGTAALWGALEVVLRERPGPNGELPLIHALVKSKNTPALQAFETVLFEPHEFDDQPQQQWRPTTSGLFVPVPADTNVAVVRKPGEPPPEYRDFDAYRPVLGAEFFEASKSTV